MDSQLPQTAAPGSGSGPVKTPALELRGICKQFGRIAANKNVDLTAYKGEVLAILGENGSGKTTLMNMIAGIYYPDAGEIFIDGERAVITSPKDAYSYGIGMIHQHFKLVDVFSAAENIALGLKDRGYDLKKAKKTALETAAKYGFSIDPDKKIYEMSVSEKQTVEIVKVLLRGAKILILDEPTAVLTPQETGRLFAVLESMKKDGKTILIITHKLHEVLAVSDRVAVLRKGEYAGTVNTCETNEEELTELMVGKKVELNIDRTDPVGCEERLSVNGLCLNDEDGKPALKSVSFAARAGEILGIAGIAGSGQRELLETIAGLRRPDEGTIVYHDPKSGKDVDLCDRTPTQIRDLGVRLSFVPEDRLGMGLVGSMDLTDNMMLRSYGKGRSAFLDRGSPKKLALRVVKDLEVSTPGVSTPVRRLSGGNVQKVLVGREISSAPTVLMAAYPVRGLDINSSYMIYNLLNDQKAHGTAVIFVGKDLDVLLDLCDRIMVMCAGGVAGIVDARSARKEELGLLMTGSVDAGQKGTVN